MGRTASADKHRNHNGVAEKLCSSCKKWKPMLPENFSTRSASPDGLAYSCKDCERKSAKRSYSKTKKKVADKKRYQENKEEYIERSKKRYQENKEEILENQKEWRQSEKGKKSMSDAQVRRQERMIAQTPGGRDYVVEQVIEKCTKLGMVVCGVCGRAVDMEDRQSWHVDHIVGIAAGGADLLENVQIAHKTCNLTRPKDCSDLENK